MVGWIGLAIVSLGWQVGSHFFLDYLFEQTDLDLSLFTTLVQLNFGLRTVLWLVLLVGLWMTAEALDARRLRQSAGCLGLHLLLMVGINLAFMANVFDGLDAIDRVRDVYMTLGGGLLIAGGALILAHAKERGADSSALTIPGIALAVDLALIFIGPMVMEQVDTPSMKQLWFLVTLASSAFFWLCWFALPRSAFADQVPEAVVIEGEDGAPPMELGPTHDPTQDLLVGGLWAAGGVLVTVLSFAGGGIDGRAVLAWGPIVYGVFRIIRGLSKRA
ncbi:hypothetical protein PPSIR1_29016 [Plesiocystis pacifica SIR-1]|uniref:Uncharacterized protein n=1 Tax=Plesiocystis pacifica SIR-1 TaxID=391625 RepID=A6GEZ1_9BACT|nr:hypothetical protein [Plesiocystis pacifica]EDM75583.1 hypothetical protein PPSIR1_29016 [Plesiocystis pacifica SIR-1]